MTVQELIKSLEAFDSNTPVVFNNGEEVELVTQLRKTDPNNTDSVRQVVVIA